MDFARKAPIPPPALQHAQNLRARSAFKSGFAALLKRQKHSIIINKTIIFGEQMTVYHFTGEKECESFEEMEKVLLIRTKEIDDSIKFPEEANTFTLCTENATFPFMIMMVKNDAASLYCVLEEEQAGFMSIGQFSDEEGNTVFYADTGEENEVSNRYCLPFSKALNVCKEFFETLRLPTCIEWEEL
jgi:hypothetical protein